MFESLSDRLERSFKILKGEGRITEINVAETLKDVRKALLDADVNYKVAKTFTDTVKEKAIGQNVLTALKPQQLMVKIVHDELSQLMGGSSVDINLKGSPAVILMSGLQGSGKTTFSGKLANLLKTKRAKRPLLVACDVYRPAAIEQLKVLGEQLGIPVYSDEENKNPVKIAEAAIRHARNMGNDVVIVDTAGRLAIDELMMNEISAIKQAIQPQEILFVVDAMTGQDAVNTAKEFNERLNFDGVVLTKLDGDTRGGAALSIRTVVDKPIKFVGTGEKVDAFELFYPDRVANRLMGMGDLMSLVEVAQEKIDQMAAEKTLERMMEGTFTLSDMLQQFEQLSKMGSLKSMMAMLPGMGQMAQQVNDTESAKAISKSKAIIYSMTLEEREDPSLLRASRKNRIALGSGTSVTDVNRILSQYEKAKEQARMVRRLMKNNPNLK